MKKEQIKETAALIFEWMQDQDELTKIKDEARHDLISYGHFDRDKYEKKLVDYFDKLSNSATEGLRA